MEVYLTDSGHHMEEDDFMQYLRLLKNTDMKEKSLEQFINIIWDQEYFGDSIIDQQCFLRMKINFKNYHNASLSEIDEK
jgi:hypothetical protein